MERELENSKMRVDMFRTEHLLIVPAPDPEKYLILCIPEEYIKNKNFSAKELREIFKNRNGEICMCPDGIRFVMNNVNLYYDEASGAFQEKAKKKGFDVFLDMD